MAWLLKMKKTGHYHKNIRIKIVNISLKMNIVHMLWKHFNINLFVCIKSIHIYIQKYIDGDLKLKVWFAKN